MKTMNKILFCRKKEKKNRYNVSNFWYTSAFTLGIKKQTEEVLFSDWTRNLGLIRKVSPRNSN